MPNFLEGDKYCIYVKKALGLRCDLDHLLISLCKSIRHWLQIIHTRLRRSKLFN